MKKNATKKTKKKTKKKKAPKAKAKTSRKPAVRAAKNDTSWEPRRRHFMHDGLKMHYWEWGDSQEETYVFVHGVREQGRSWDHFLHALPEPGVPIKHALALDLRGHGHSEWPSSRRAYQNEDFLPDVACFLHRL